MRRHLIKYYDNKTWAEKLIEGEALFRSLSYFRTCEDDMRRDEGEGDSIFKPEGGLDITKSDGTKLTFPAYRSHAVYNQIFAFCMSRARSPLLAKKFRAVACVEITNVEKFIIRMKSALPEGTVFYHRRVDYYDPTKPPGNRYAFPKFIATSTVRSYQNENEYRLVFGTAEAMARESLTHHLVQGNKLTPPLPACEHKQHLLKAPSLSDFAKLHDL